MAGRFYTSLMALGMGLVVIVAAVLAGGGPYPAGLTADELVVMGWMGLFAQWAGSIMGMPR